MNAKKCKLARNQARLSAQLEGVQKENNYEVIPNRVGQKRNIHGGTVVLANCERALYRQIKKYNKNSGSAVKQPE